MVNVFRIRWSPNANYMYNDVRWKIVRIKNLSTHQLSAPSPSTTSRPSRDMSSPKVHPISKANSSYQKILLHNQLCSFKFPIVLCELCFVLHFHSFIVSLAVLFVDLVHCILLFAVRLSRPSCNQVVSDCFWNIKLTYLHMCLLAIATVVVLTCSCLCDGHGEPCKNSRTDWDAISWADLCGPKK